MFNSPSSALILAAGESSRFGGIKALAPWQDSNLLTHTLRLAYAVCPEKVAVVTGAHVEALTPYLGEVQVIHNPHWSQGMGSSLACGVRALKSSQPARILLLLVDQPFVTPQHLRQLIQASFGEDRTILTGNGSHSSPPGCLHPRDYALAEKLSGDHGLRAALGEQYGLIIAPEVTPDVDTFDELLSFKES